MNSFALYSGACGVNDQVNVDKQMLMGLGFSEFEINTLQNILINGGRTSINSIVGLGLTYEDARRIKYMHDICIGKVVIENTDDLIKHLRRIYRGHRIGIGDLAVSRISRVNRKAVVAGITDPTFKIYNSKQYKLYDKMYDVVSVTGRRILVETNRKPVLKFKQPKFIEGILEITEVKENGNIIVAFDKRYCKLCNRFIVVGALRKPEFHHGLIEIICVDGTKVYVFAKTLGTRETVSYNMGTQRVYDYGYFAKDIKEKINMAGNMMYRQLGGVHAEIYPANQDYRPLTIEEVEDTDEIVIQD